MTFPTILEHEKKIILIAVCIILRIIDDVRVVCPRVPLSLLWLNNVK